MKKAGTLLKSWLLIVSVLSSHISFTQIANYVTNGGFEQYLSCTGPNTGYLKPNVPGWDEIDSEQGAKWNHFCYGAIPNTGFFMNYPRSDSAFTAFDVYCLTCPVYGLRTNLRNTLKGPLLPGKTYCVKFFVNNSEYSSYSIDAFDVYFGGSELDTITTAHVPLTYLDAQVRNGAGVYITDTIGWTLVSGTFTATGGEKYMVLGNLRSDTATGTITSNPAQSAQQWSFCTIGIDDVSCIPVDLPAYAGNDTVCFAGSAVYLGRARDVGIDEACRWYRLPANITHTTPAIDTAAGIWVSPAQTSTYVVRQEICGNVKWDTVVVYTDGVGIAERSDESFDLWPNPAGRFLEIQTADPSGYDFKIADQTGRQLMNGQLPRGSKTHQLSLNIPPGLYYITISSSAGRVVKKLVVETNREL